MTVIERPTQETDLFKLTWTIKKVTEKQLVLEVKFNKPMRLSLSHNWDILQIEFSETSLNAIFVSDDNKKINPKRRILKKKIRPQLPPGSDDFLYAVQASSEGIRWMFWIGLALNFIDDKAAIYMSMLVRTLQLVILQCLLKIRISSQGLVIIDAVTKIGFWDLLDGFDLPTSEVL